MGRLRTIGILGAAAVLLFPCIAVHGSEKRDVETREIRLRAPPGGRIAVPKYEYGLLVFWHLGEPGMPHFTVLDPFSERTVAQITAEAPEARETYPMAFAVFPDRRRFVVSAATLNYSGKRSLWLLFYGADGKLTHHQRITPFHPSLLAVAEDGTVWGAGCNERTVDEWNSAEPVLYQWSEDGRLLKRLLAQRDFLARRRDYPAGGRGVGITVRELGMSALAVSRDRVVLFDTGSGVLAEISTSGGVLGMYTPPRRHLPDGKPTSSRGLAVTGDGEIYAAFDRICRFNRASRAWEPVEDPPALAGMGVIFGSSDAGILRSGESGDRFHFRLVTMK